jgi:uncharacterized protein (DUF305 family)
MRHRTPLALLGVAATFLVACGSDDDAATTTAASMPAATTADGESSDAQFNEADVEFAQGMIAHHEQAIEMAEIALDPNVGARAEVVDLATRIMGAQDPEIALMTQWLGDWGQPVTMDTSGGHEMSEMEGMMSAEEMDALAASTGAEFDTMWMEMMIRHHEGAIAQSEDVKASGSNPDVLALADQIISAQQGEITEMEQLLAGS